MEVRTYRKRVVKPDEAMDLIELDRGVEHYGVTRSRLRMLALAGLLPGAKRLQGRWYLPPNLVLDKKLTAATKRKDTNRMEATETPALTLTEREAAQRLLALLGKLAAFLEEQKERSGS